MVETLFVELVRSFVYDRFAQDPVSATVAGVHAHDHEYGDHTAAGYAARREFSESSLRRFEEAGEVRLRVIYCSTSPRPLDSHRRMIDTGAPGVVTVRDVTSRLDGSKAVALAAAALLLGGCGSGEPGEGSASNSTPTHETKRVVALSTTLWSSRAILNARTTINSAQDCLASSCGLGHKTSAQL